MKEAIEELIDRYKRRIDSVTQLLKDYAGNPEHHARLTAKRAVYQDVVIELQCLLEDEHET